MRVLFWSLTFWPNIGGMEVHAARLLPCLRERGHEFLVVAPRNHTNLPEHDRYDGIPVRRLPFQHALAPAVHHVAEVRAEVMRLKRDFAPDLVHVNGLGAMAFFHVTTLRAHPAASLVTLHGDWGRLADAVAAPALQSADRVVGCSSAILARARQLVPAIAQRSSVVHNGVDAATMPIPRRVREPRLLYVGRLAEDKGADRLIDVFAQVRRHLPRARLTIAGEGPLRSALAERAATLDAADAVDFIGWVHPDAVASHINDHAVVLMPSREDSLPLVALEAGAMARPVVATRVGGFPEVVVDGVTGRLANGDDIGTLADAVTRLLADPALAERLGTAARQRIVERFSWTSHVDRYDALYRACATPRVPHRAEVAQ